MCRGCSNFCAPFFPYFSIIIYNATIKLSRRYTDQQVLEAINLLKNTKISVPEIAKQLKMKTGVIYGINDGKTHRDMHSYPIPIRNKKGA